MAVSSKIEYGIKLMDMLFASGKDKLAYELFSDKEMSSFLVNDLNLFSVMYLLVEKKRVDDAIAAFDIYLAHTNNNLADLNLRSFMYLSKALFRIVTKFFLF